MGDTTDTDYEHDEKDIEILVDTLRQCFLADKARYYMDGNSDALIIEIEGLEALSQDEITEVAAPVLDELDLDFDEISLIPLT